MSTYRVKTGHDQTLMSLTVLDPQPDDRHGGGIQYAQISRAANGAIIKQGPFFPFTWEQLEAADYAIIIALFGVNAADYANVTVYVRDVNLSNWIRMNGIAQRPFPADTVSWEVRPQSVTIMVTDLVAAS